MSATSSIEWTQNADGTAGKTWNPIRGCSVVSPGCHNCYAMKQAHRFSAPGKPFHGLTKQTKAGPQWTGVVRTVESALLEPLSWRKPQRVFVNSMSDLFHEDVPDEFIDRVFGTMARCAMPYREGHTFQILTKRADRMRAYVSDKHRPERVAIHAPLMRVWPLPNVWLGVSVEDQQRADERIPLLLQTPAAVRFLSCEPLLGPVSLGKPLFGSSPDYVTYKRLIDGINWVIVGGESGPGARPFDVAWARSIVKQCKAAGVPVFVKQVGAGVRLHTTEHGRGRFVNDGDFDCLKVYDKKGGDPSEWPEDIRVREFPVEGAHR